MTNPVYTVVMSKAAVKALEAVQPRKHRVQLRDKILDLEQDPRPVGYEPVKSQPGVLRIRQGDWRVLYRLDDQARTVAIVDVRRRNEGTY